MKNWKLLFKNQTQTGASIWCIYPVDEMSAAVNGRWETWTAKKSRFDEKNKCVYIQLGAKQYNIRTNDKLKAVPIVHSIYVNKAKTLKNLSLEIYTSINPMIY